MDTVTTTLAHAGSRREEWTDFGQFLKRPRLPDAATGPSVAGLRGTLRILLLDLAVMGVLIAAAGVALLAGITLPENDLSKLTLDGGTLALIVLAAPIGEELVFRSWLSGRPGHLLALLILAAGFLGAGVAIAGGHKVEAMIAGAGAVALATGAFWLLRRCGAMRWFARAFPLFFWLSVAAFASVHLFNYAEGSLAILLPLVLPQFALGTMLGYLRVTYGLWSSVLLHALHNALFIGMVWLATEAGAR